MHSSTEYFNTEYYSPVQYIIIQQSTVQFKISTVQYSAVQYSTVQYSTAQYSTAQYSNVQYSTVQYSTVQYCTVQYFLLDQPNLSGLHDILMSIAEYNFQYYPVQFLLKLLVVRTSLEPQALLANIPTQLNFQVAYTDTALVYVFTLYVQSV